MIETHRKRKSVRDKEGDSLIRIERNFAEERDRDTEKEKVHKHIRQGQKQGNNLPNETLTVWRKDLT